MPNCPYCDESYGAFSSVKRHSSLTHDKPPFHKEDIAEFLQDLANELGDTPTTRDLVGTKYTQKDVLKLFDTWNEAISYAGLETRASRTAGPGRGNDTNLNEQKAREQVVSDIRAFHDEHGCPPTQREYEQYDKTHGLELASKRLFESWNDALKTAGVGIVAGPVEDRFGEDNPAYIDGSSKEENYYGLNWRDQRQKALERDGYECRACGMTQEEHKQQHGKALEVHHVVPLRQFDDPEDGNSLGNLVTACVPCHRRFEGVPVFPD